MGHFHQKSMLMATLLFIVAGAGVVVQAGIIFESNCKSGLDLGEECSENNECSTAFARCLDGKCSCVGGFQPKNVTVGFPAMCVPVNPLTEPDELLEANGDICRINRDSLLPLDQSIKPNPDYLALVFGESNARRLLHRHRTRRLKRQTSFSGRLPPTLVSNCRGSQACFQIFPSAYGVCSKPQCPMGEPVSSTTSGSCTIGAPSSCPSGYECHQSLGQKQDAEGNAYQATICCPRICEGKGTYLDGKCYKDRKCMDSLLKCTLRCEHEPCRFMVNPCENYGQCLVPNRRGNARPEYFWCHCAGRFKGEVCQDEGDNFGNNGPSKSRQLECKGTFCDPPPVEKVVVTVMQPFPPPPRPTFPGGSINSGMFAYQQQASRQPFFNNLFAGGAGPRRNMPQKLVAPPLPTPTAAGSRTKGKLTCRRNLRADCDSLAATGHCVTSKPFMVNNCDCACSRTIVRGIFGGGGRRRSSASGPYHNRFL